MFEWKKFVAIFVLCLFFAFHYILRKCHIFFFSISVALMLKSSARCVRVTHSCPIKYCMQIEKQERKKTAKKILMWVCVTQVEPMKCYFNWIFSTIKSKPEYEKTLCSYDLMSPDVFFHLKLCAQQKSLHLLISLSTLELIQWNVDYLNDFCKWLQLGITERGSKCV